MEIKERCLKTGLYCFNSTMVDDNQEAVSPLQFVRNEVENDSL